MDWKLEDISLVKRRGENIWTKKIIEKAKKLENILSEKDKSRTAGEYLESLREQDCETEELEAVALFLSVNQTAWRGRYHFNDDYRSRILEWLLKQGGKSIVIQAACAVLAGSDDTLVKVVLGEHGTVEGLKQKKDEAVISASDSSSSPMAAFFVLLSVPEYYAQLAKKIDEFLMDRKTVLAHPWHLRLASNFFKYEKRKGKSKLFSAFQALSAQNVTESTAAFKTLSEIYSRTEIIALNLLLFGFQPMDIVTDNICKNFIAAIASLKEEDSFTEFEAEMLSETLSMDFSRKVGGSNSTRKYFANKLIGTINSYHTVFKDTGKWNLLYRAIMGDEVSNISFHNAGFLAFDPLEQENSTKWNLLNSHHKKQLLEYRCRSLHLSDLGEPYPEEWRYSMEIVTRLLKSTRQEESQKTGQPASVDEFLYGMCYTVNAMIQAGFMEIPDEKDRAWLLGNEQKLEYQYMLRYLQKHGKLPEWISCHFEGQSLAYNEFRFIAESSFSETEKGDICLAMLDGVWSLIPCCYHKLMCLLFDQQPELLKTFLNKDEMASLAETLMECPDVMDTERNMLSRYTMSEAEWDRCKKESEAAKQEKRDLEELKKLQDSLKNVIVEIASFDNVDKTWELVHKIRWFNEPFIKPELARIATQSIREQDLPIAKKIQLYSEIAQAAGCDAHLFNELRKIVKERYGNE